MFHTPKKSSGSSPNKTFTLAGPRKEVEEVPSLNVRRSIGEWETGKTDHSRSSLSPQTALMDSSARILASNPMTMAPVSPPRSSNSKTFDRLAEARSLLIKAKQHLNNSRNLKTDIKQGVLQAIERLYQLVKETHTIKKVITNKQPTETQECDVVTKQEKEITECKLEKLIEKQSELIRESNEKIDGLKELLERKTYACVAAIPPKLPKPQHTALHSVVVSAKDELETGEEVLDKIRKAVNAKDGGIAVEKIRKAKDAKVIVACRTEAERKKLKEKLSKASELNVEDIKNKDPLVMLRDVFTYNSDDEIMRALRNQNRSLFDTLQSDDTRCEIAYKKRTRNPHTSHIVMRVSPKLWQAMVVAETVHIDLQRVKVVDQSPLVQCSLCLGYGHGRRFCTESVEKCSHCGGPHLKEKCEDWLTNAPPSCCNCVSAKLEKTGHNAFSNECVIRKKWEALARATIAYC